MLPGRRQVAAYNIMVDYPRMQSSAPANGRVSGWNGTDGVDVVGPSFRRSTLVEFQHVPTT